MAELIFINLSRKYAALLGISGGISNDVYQLIHHPENSEVFLKFITTTQIWGSRAQKEQAAHPFRRNALNDLTGFGSFLSDLRSSGNILFLRTVFNARKVDKPNVHVELGRFNKFYSIIYVEYFKAAYSAPSPYVQSFYLHHFLEHACYECSSQESHSFDVVDVKKLRDRLTYEPEMDEVEGFVRQYWSNIWTDYLELRGW